MCSSVSLLSTLLVEVSVVDLTDDMLVVKLPVVFMGKIFPNCNVSNVVGEDFVLVKLIFNNVN